MLDSVSTWRTYSAEESVPLGRTFDSIDEVRAFVQKVRRSAWWRRSVAYEVNIRTELGGGAFSRDDDAWISSWAQPRHPGIGKSTRWTVSLHPRMLNDVIVLHELAHCIAPRFVHSGRRRRFEETHQHSRTQVHGTGFTGTLAELVEEFSDASTHDELRAAYVHYEVPCLEPEERQIAVEESLLAEKDDLDMRAEFDAYAKANPRPPNVPEGRIPEFTWGDMLLFTRARSGRRVGREPMAATISATGIKATARQIKRVEESRGVPDDPHLRRVAMCLAVALRLDPIALRYQMGLTRWACDVTLDELRVINSGWVELVESMNQALENRPPRWMVAGDR